MQPPIVGVEVGHDFEGRDLHIESLGMLQVVVPNLIDDVAEEFGNAMFGCLVAGVVIEVGFVGSLSANTDDGRGISGNVPVVEGEAGRPDKLEGAMVVFVLGGLHEDGCKRMDSFQLVIWDDHEKGEKGLPDCKQVIVGWFPFEERESVISLFEEAGDCLSIHVGWLLGRITCELGEYVSWQEEPDGCCRGSR